MRKKGENDIKPPRGKRCDPLDEIMMSPLGVEVNTPAHALATAHERACVARLSLAARAVGRPKSKPAGCWGGGAEFFPEGATPHLV
jgi:hypothetical protein